MNVLLAPVRYLPMHGGVPMFTLSVSRALLTHGHKATIVAPALDGQAPGSELVDGVNVCRMRFPWPWPFTWQTEQPTIRRALPYFFSDLVRLVRLIIVQKIDLIDVLSMGSSAPYAWFASLITRRPLHVSLHGNEFIGVHADTNRVRRRMLRRALCRAERVTAVSRKVMREAEEFEPASSGKLDVIPNGVWLEEFDEVEPFEFAHPYIVCIGRLNQVKGIDVLLHAFARIVSRETEACLLIAGDGPERVRLQALVLALGLQHRVKFLGQLSPEAVRGLLKGCQFLVLTSWAEGMPGVILEAMASGKAVVATGVGGVDEVVQHQRSGILVSAGDVDATADAICRLSRDPALARAMGAHGRKIIERRHDLNVIMPRYLEVYRHCVDCKQHP